MILLNLIKELADCPVNSEEYGNMYFELKNILANNMVHVEFVKKNGEYRLMDCTNNHTYISRHSNVGVSKPGHHDGDEEDMNLMLRDMNNRLIRCFDTEKNEFRSFKFESVQDAYIVEEL